VPRGGGAMTERVVVAGAGPVGLIVALVLARADIPVLVLEAASAIAQAPRAIVYHPPTVEVLDRLDLLPAMAEAGLLKHTYQWRSADGEIIAGIDSSALHADDTKYPFNLHLGQHRLAEIALAALLRHDAAEVRFGHRVTGVAQTADAVRIAVRGPNGDDEIRAPWLIGADGASSGVRQALGFSFEGTTWPEWFVATDIRFDFESHGFAEANFILDPVDWAIVPKIDRSGLWRFTYGEPPDVARETLRARAPAKFRALLPGGAVVEPDAFAPYRVHTRCAPSFRANRVLLAGDAAHVVNPVGGLGLTGGILDAAALGDAMIARWRSAANDGALDHYARERRRIFVDVIAPTANENKRRLMETEPVKREQDRARLRALAADPAAARAMLLSTQRLVGTPGPV